MSTDIHSNISFARSEIQTYLFSKATIHHIFHVTSAIGGTETTNNTAKNAKMISDAQNYPDERTNQFVVAVALHFFRLAIIICSRSRADDDDYAAGDQQLIKASPGISDYTKRRSGSVEACCL